MDFAVFADRAHEIERESADSDIRQLVTELLRTAGSNLPAVSRFIQGRIFPEWDQTKLDIGPALCYEAIARAAGQNVSVADVEDQLATVGDIGEVAASYEFGGQRGLSTFTTGDRSNRTESTALTIEELEAQLTAVATAQGAGSQDRKLDLLFGLFNRCSPDEARYLARLVLSEMRIGVGEGTVRDAIAAAFDVDVEAVERAIQVSNDVGLVATTARDDGSEGLENIHLDIGRPVKAMLAQSGTISESLEAWEEAIVQWKYDGARIQSHIDDEVRLFSRNMEDVTDALPEIVEFLEASVDNPAILDGEVVAVDDHGDPLPFQNVLRRFRRKHDVEQAMEDVELQPYFFDCLHVDGEDLLDQPLTDRHHRLATLLEDGVSEIVTSADTQEIATIEGEALEAGHEGIMLKNPDSTYTPGRRGKNWLKRKPDVETVDCVVTGAEWGEGRRASLLGTFHLSLRNDDGYVRVGNVATGITDEQLAELTDRLTPLIRSEDGQLVDIEPQVVFEIGYEEIQRSPTYSSGYALRFPRFLGVREDLNVADADSLERLEELVDQRG